jgi:hypothetical protein
VCFAALLSCGDRGSASSSPARAGGEAGPGAIVAADATVGGATEDSSRHTYLPEASAVIGPPPDSGLSTGPDGAAPVACDADAAPATQCTVAPTECADGGGVLYTGGWCVAGTCNWLPYSITCSGGEVAPGGRCAPPGTPTTPGAVVIDDAGTWVVARGCMQAVPAAPPPPQVSCPASSGGSDACPPTRSQCVSSQWLVYYDQGVCVGGQCSWQERYASCSGSRCVSGACLGVGTPPPM